MGRLWIFPHSMVNRLAALILLALMTAACGAANSRTQPTVQTPATLLPERTSVMLRVTPQPSPTVALPPTPTLEVLPTSAPIVDDPGSSDLPDYYGGLVITLDYVGQTIFMKPGHGFLFSLGDSFDWQITVDPPEVVTINQRYLPQPGEQGVWIAREKGKAMVRAVGSPRCLKNDPPCARPNVLFTLYVEVE